MNPSYAYGWWKGKDRKGMREKRDGCRNGIWIGNCNPMLTAGNGSIHVNTCGIKQSEVVVSVAEDEVIYRPGDLELDSELLQPTDDSLQQIDVSEYPQTPNRKARPQQPPGGRNRDNCECPCSSGIKVGNGNRGAIGNGSIHINICNVKESEVIVEIETEEEPDAQNCIDMEA